MNTLRSVHIYKTTQLSRAMHNLYVAILLTSLALTIGVVACSNDKPVQTLGSTDQALTAAASGASSCNLKSLKGTYSFDATGYAPAPPPDVIKDQNGHVLNPAVNFGTVIPLHAIGHVWFDGEGLAKGYIHENVGGIFEDSVPFNGSYELAVGPQGIGCQGKWVLQDHHRLFPFTEEGPHFFRITLAPESKGFHFVTEGGGPGPVTLSGWAPLAVK